jgi:hypothetical protein
MSNHATDGKEDKSSRKHHCSTDVFGLAPTNIMKNYSLNLFKNTFASKK